MGFVSFKERGVGHLPRWSVGHAHQARLWISGVQGSEHSASSVPMSPVGGESGDSACLCVVNGGHPSLTPPPGDRRRLVTLERWATTIRTSRGVPHSSGRPDSCRSVWWRHGEGPLASDALSVLGCTEGVPASH